MEIWHDLAYIYIRLSRWHDAEVCLSKSKAIKLYSASRCHVIGKYMILLSFFYFFLNNVNWL